MEKKEILQKKELVDKYLNKRKFLCLLDVFFYNVENLSVYIRLDYNPKNATYLIHWINISAMEDNKIENWLNSNLIYPSLIDKIKNIIASNGIVEDYKEDLKIDSKVTINSYLKDYKYNRNTFEFNRYIPTCWMFLADVLLIVFEGMPRYMYSLFQILVEKIIEPSTNCAFIFDLKNGDINQLFEKQIIERGKKYYKEDRIKFIEKQDDCYSCIVRGTTNYLVSIINKEDTKEVQMSCNCQYEGFCKHIYAALLAIKSNDEHKFFKISYIDGDKSLIDNIKNFNYLLCIGIVDDFFVVVDNLDLAFIPILKDNKLLFKIVEDDNNKTLEKQLNKYLKKHQK